MNSINFRNRMDIQYSEMRLAKPLSEKRSCKLAIALPSSFISDIPHLREKTFRIGLIGRAAAIFRIDEVIVYPDVPQTDQRADARLIQTILTYMETPQYLRKRLFKIVPELQYAGTLPPLRTPHHPTANRTKDLRVSEFREGVVISQTGKGCLVDIGVEEPALVQGATLRPNTRITARITEAGRHPKAILASPREIRTYWGYQVTTEEVALGQLIRRRRFDLVIATSRRGKPISVMLNELEERWSKSQRTLVAFGAPTQGLYEIAAHEGIKLEDLADFVVNTIPNQATETVRTEEAVYATLSILNTLGKANLKT